jgi:thioredoxin:protein disulfide reductase
MGLGMGIPLLLIGVSAGKWLPKTGPWMIAVKEMFGILLLGMAIWMLSRILPPVMTRLLWMALSAGAIAYIILGLTRSRRLHRKWAYTLGVAAGLMSLLLIANNMSSIMNLNNNMLASNFVVGHNLQDLTTQLKLAKQEQKAVLVDFYADWCESCVLMDQKVFDKPHVQQALKNYVLLRVDLTANDNNDQAVMKKYSVVAPPTVLLFDKAGQENTLQRIVGEVDGKEFLSRLNTFELASCSTNKINC